MFWTIFYQILVVLSVSVYVAADPCTSYKVIVGNDTRAANIKLDLKTTHPYTDDRLQEGWHRIENEVGEEIADFPPGVFNCSTWYPIWLNGSLPTTENETVTQQVCVQTFMSVCHESWTIDIKRCQGGYLVYNLKPSTLIDSGYCFGWAEPCADDESSETGLQPGCSTMYPRLNITVNVASYLEEGHVIDHQYGPSLVPVFKCDFSKENYFYDIYWYINDETVKVHKNIASGNLTYSHLRPNNWVDQYTMNMQVKCSARARLGKNMTPSPHVYSVAFTAGLVASSSFVEVLEGQLATISFHPTIPVGCKWKNNQSSCIQTLYIGQTNTHHPAEKCLSNVKIGDLVFKTQSCGINISSAEWNKQIELKVAGYADQRYNSDKYRTTDLQFLPKINSLDPSGVWRKIIVPNTRVQVEDGDLVVAGKACLLFTDSYLVDFNGNQYPFNKAGEYILYNAKNMAFSVHILLTRCGIHATCICGIAVRSWNSIFIYRTCNKISQQFGEKESTVPFEQYKSCNEKDMKVQQTQRGYKITLPSGTEISFRRNRWWIQSIILKSSLLDVDLIDGLCLTADTVTDFTSYTALWRVSDTTKQLFDQSYQSQFSPSLSSSFCFCSSAEGAVHHFSSNTLADCNLPSPVKLVGCKTERRLNGECGVMNPGINPTDDVTDMTPLIYDELYNPNITMTPIWTNGWTEASARTECETFIAEIECLQICEQYGNLNKEIFVNGCINNIKATGNVNFMSWVTGAIQDFCYVELSRNETFLEMKTDDGTLLLDVVLDQMCPNDCSNHGSCVKGRCECNADYIGSSCASQRLSAPLDILIPENGLCKRSKRPCLETPVNGEFLNGTIICRLTKFIIDADGIEYSDISTTVNADYSHEFSISCPFPVGRRKRSAEKLAEGYIISLSYDGINYGGNASVIIYDDNCVSCNHTTMKCVALDTCQTTTSTTTTTKDDDSSEDSSEDEDQNKDESKGMEDKKFSAAAVVCAVLSAILGLMLFVTVGFILLKKYKLKQLRQNDMNTYRYIPEDKKSGFTDLEVFVTSKTQYPPESPPPYSSRRPSACSQLSLSGGWTGETSKPPVHLFISK